MQNEQFTPRHSVIFESEPSCPRKILHRGKFTLSEDFSKNVPSNTSAPPSLSRPQSSLYSCHVGISRRGCNFNAAPNGLDGLKKRGEKKKEKKKKIAEKFWSLINPPPLINHPSPRIESRFYLSSSNLVVSRGDKRDGKVRELKKKKKKNKSKIFSIPHRRDDKSLWCVHVTHLLDRREGSFCI